MIDTYLEMDIEYDTHQFWEKMVSDYEGNIDEYDLKECIIDYLRHE